MSNESKIKQLLAEAWVKRREGNYKASRNLVKEAQRICDADDYNALGRIFHIYMQFEADAQNPAKALELCKKSLSYYKKAANPDKIAHSTRHIADLESLLGKDEDAEGNYREAIRIYRDDPNSSIGDLANALRAFGLLLEKCGKIEEAIDIWKMTKELYQAINLQDGVDEANKKLNALI
ncbi:MAG: tetratricopeptide repeat protein [Bacteroidia bacterium]|nr:tetratricopeptide repeat protein [Bacteroidia bacterium]